MMVLCEVCFNSECDLFTSSLYHPNTSPKDIFEHYNFLVGLGTNLSEKEIQDGGECRSSVWSPFSGQIINPPCSCGFFCPVMYKNVFPTWPDMLKVLPTRQEMNVNDVM